MFAVRLSRVLLPASSLLMALGLAGGAASAGSAARPGDGSGAPGQAGAPEPTVVGGQPAPAGKWPDAAALYSNGQQVCTGTLIAPTVVLSAGHCTDGIDLTEVKLNATDTEGPGEVIEVASATAHPNWETTYDVSVLVLAAPSTITPRAVATDCVVQAALVDAAPVMLVGFGATDEQGQVQNTTLMEGQAAIEDADCSGGNGCVAAVAPGGEFVAGGTSDSCYGDSGGPVYLTTPESGTVVAGVVSRGVEDSPTPCGAGGIYVRPDAVLDWIETTAGVAVTRATCAAPDEETPETPDENDGGDDGAGGDDDGSAGGGDVAGAGGGVTGGCAAGGGAGAGQALALLLLLVLATRSTASACRTGRSRSRRAGR